MKAFMKDFLLRGSLAAAGGPVVLAIVYGILGATGVATALSPAQVCMGILTVTLLAFLVAGMTAIYQVERLFLPAAITIHGGVLYLTYILIYLLNGWLQRQLVPVLVFTGIFVAGYALIWLMIYLVCKRGIDQLNKKLKQVP